jgi:argininosuccinate synthase
VSDAPVLVWFRGGSADVELVDRFTDEGPVVSVEIDAADLPLDEGREELASEHGVREHRRLDLRQDVFSQAIRPLLFAGGAHHGDPLWWHAAESVSAGALVRLALELKASVVAVAGSAERLAFVRRVAESLAPGLSIVTVDAPDLPPEEAGELWGRRLHVPALDDPWEEPELDELFGDAPPPDEACDLAEELDLEFDEGVLESTPGGPEQDGPGVLRLLGQIGRRHALGQRIVLADDALGVRRRWAIEAPAAAIVEAAHRALEVATLEPQRLALKERLAVDYREGLRRGAHYAPQQRDLEAFLEANQRSVSGTVRVHLYRGAVQLLGVKAR